MLIIQHADYSPTSHPHCSPYSGQKSLWSSTHEWKKCRKYLHFSHSSQQRSSARIPSRGSGVKLLPLPLFWFVRRTFSNLISPGWVVKVYTENARRRGQIVIGGRQLSNFFLPSCGVTRRTRRWRLPLNSLHTYCSLTFILDVFSHFK